MTRKYTKDHEWVQIENNIATIGISEHAAEALGELVYVELPKVGTKFNKGDAAVVVESSKSASDVYTPISGEVVEVNESLVSTPENVNSAPYQNGWLIKIKTNNAGDLDDCMNEADYQNYLKENN
jgi:glycine cleavage system H protein